MKKRLSEIGLYVFDKLLNLILIAAALFLLLVIVRVFFFSSFKIPSDSMEPTLKMGDNILVTKVVPGPRLFDLLASLQGEPVDIYRVPGIRRVKRNDVVVFQFPLTDDWSTVKMSPNKYYVKRCIALPGDTFSICNGYMKVEGVDFPLGNMADQQKMSHTPKEEIDINAWNAFPYSATVGWNIKDMGPFYLPKKGDSIVLNTHNAILYKRYIEWEQGDKLEEKEGRFYLGDIEIEKYTFLKNYYFMAGDNPMNSQDCRYFGPVPEEFIVGKALLIWRSVDPYTKEFLWNRFFKIIR